MKTTNIYALVDPRTNLIRYIGKTNNLSQRYKAHLNRVRKHQTHKRNWLESLKKENLKPILLVLDEVPIEDWVFWETYWISQVKAWGFNLVNHTSGGDGCTFSNQTSFKKGHTTWNKGTANIEICTVCSKQFIASPSLKQKTCSKKCAIKIRTGHEQTQFKKGSIPWNKGKIGHRLNAKSVIQMDLNENFINEFYSCKDAALAMNCIAENIRRACVGKSKTAKGFKWKYNDK